MQHMIQETTATTAQWEIWDCMNTAVSRGRKGLIKPGLSLFC